MANKKTKNSPAKAKSTAPRGSKTHSTDEEFQPGLMTVAISSASVAILFALAVITTL